MIIDVHTHMYGREWLHLLEERGAPAYEVRPAAAGRTIFTGDTVVALPRPEHFDYPLRIAAMDRHGIDLAIVSLTCPNVYWGGPETSLAAARLVNDEMAEAERTWPDRIRWFASLPWEYPEAAVAELDRAKAAGASGVMVLSNIAGRWPTDPHFASVWARIDALALPVLVHPTAPGAAAAMDIGSWDLSYNIGFPFDTTLAVARMILSGFLDRHTRLRIIAAHGGSALPLLAGRIDRSWHVSTLDDQACKDPPSSYLARIAFDSITYSPAVLELLIRTAGIGTVMFGTDFPHIVGDFEGRMSGVDGLPPDQRKAVGHGNAMRIFGL